MSLIGAFNQGSQFTGTGDQGSSPQYYEQQEQHQSVLTLHLPVPDVQNIVMRQLQESHDSEEE